MRKLLAEDYQNFALSLSEPAKNGFRINYNYISYQNFTKFNEFSFETLDKENGLCLLNSNEKVGKTLCHHLGLIYCQEPSSSLPALCLEVKDGDRVLDLCSAPGGKASQILQNNPSGEVVLNEVIPSRANILMSNVERQGFKNAVILNKTPLELEKIYPNYFDKILVDAPCSGEGMFRKDPSTIMQWSESALTSNQKRQLEILASADKMLKQNGVLVYSTCTYNKIEDEEVVSKFCKDFGYNIEEVPDKIKKVTREGFSIDNNPKTTKARRCFIEDGYGEGQFMAKLKKISANNSDICVKSINNALKLSKNEEKIAKTLLNECIGCENLPLYKVGNKIFIYEKDIFSTKDIVMLGVCLGEMVNNRIVPHHQFFKTYFDKFKNRLNLSFDDEKVIKYIHGEELETSLNGYVCVLVNGIPLGGGKAVGGRLKNYYPKGLRN